MRRYLKKFLPNFFFNYIIKIISYLINILEILAQKYKFFQLVIFFFDSRLRNEHNACLSGKNAYYKNLNQLDKTSFLLRRNIHRLEKGLTMQTRRDIFAEDYILETVNHFAKAAKSSCFSSLELKWAIDVLDEYFKVVKKNIKTEQANLIFQEHKASFAQKDIIKPYIQNNGKFKPYKFNLLPENKINFDQLLNLFISRRSVRWFENKNVPLEIVKKAIDGASFAPSACNRQPYTFYFCNEKSKVENIAKCANGTAGYSHNIPSILVLVGNLSAYEYLRDRHLIYIDSSLAAMQLMLALKTLGLSTCPINWVENEKNEKKIRQIIQLENYERIIMMIAVGYGDPESQIAYSQKKKHDLILRDISK